MYPFDNLSYRLTIVDFATIRRLDFTLGFRFVFDFFILSFCMGRETSYGCEQIMDHRIT